MLKIAICDDTKEYLDLIKYQVKKCIDQEFGIDCNISCFSKLNDLYEYLQNNRIDILFLDIMIDDVNAMDWSIENIRDSYTQIIFITSYPQFAYNISETNCCYFLIKSKINETNLMKALKRAVNNITKKDPNLTTVKFGNRSYTINLNNIIYLETFNNNITLHMNNDNDINLYTTLKEYAKNLPPNFLRCHKCYMVNMNYISVCEPHRFIMKTGESIPIPPKKYKAITKEYLNYLNNF